MGNDKRREVTNRIISLLEQTDISQGYPNLYQHIKEWIDEIPTEKVHDGDLIFKKDAIDAILSLPRWVIDNNGEFQPVDAQTESMIDPEDAVRAIENLSSAQPKIIRCQGCQYYNDDTEECDNDKGLRFLDYSNLDQMYCPWAERRGDER